MWSLEVEKLKTVIQSELEASGLEFVELIAKRSNARTVLTILADKDGGISLEDCAAANRRLGDKLDDLANTQPEYEFLKSPYFLEVNSPGLDRPLRSRRDFERVLNQRVRLWVQNDRQGSDVLEGFLNRLSENGIFLKIDSGEEREILIEKINKGVRAIQFGGQIRK